MPTFEVQQYEVHVSTYRIEADDEAEAIAKLYAGDDEMVSFEFAGIADDLGMPVSENPELACRLFDLGVLQSDDTIIRSIRSVKQVVKQVDPQQGI